ncbi:exo-beta-N-acetylmuramidase NamZ domain-containing protein [Streptomyces sp. TRM72054]|uniref:exo-beta-N-acetylmuramidase NamZ domain-containing protein n=1 Tax=Streptomyces sp. TRM72054 TaxID=2870562 RepID=UPI0027DF9E32|nr:exo-beta-N-acetylmuramidase NamZ domain-containing protein [Streptomyces sp. TRM72054]
MFCPTCARPHPRCSRPARGWSPCSVPSTGCTGPVRRARARPPIRTPPPVCPVRDTHRCSGELLDKGALLDPAWASFSGAPRYPSGTGSPAASSPGISTPRSFLKWFEGTNLSEGRGTTQPFEVVGVPYIDARFATSLAELDLPGVRFRDLWFVPTFHKHAGRRLRGVQLHVTDRAVFAPVRTAVAMLSTLRRLYPDHFAWRAADRGVEGSDQRPFIDLLWGSDRLRRAVDAGDDPPALCDPPAPPGRWVGDDVLLCP